MKKIFIPIIVIILLTSLAYADLNDLNVCDLGTEDVRSQVTVCQGDQPFQTLNSVRTLNQINEQPYQTQGITFLYFEEEAGREKTVKALLTKDVTAEQIFPLGTFATNMIAGQGIVLVLGGESYLLELAEEQELFSTEDLQLRHIPTLASSEPVNYGGTPWYLFDALGDRKIAVGVFGGRNGQVVIQSLEGGEVPAAYVVPQNLTRNFELTFSKAEPIRVTDPAELETLTVCHDDNPRDNQQIKVCRNNALALTLQVNRLTKPSLSPASPHSILNDFVLLFEVVNGVKRVSLFSLETIRDFPALSLHYDDFIDSMVEGRRAAFEFENDLYLLEHADIPFISLQQLKLTAYTNAGNTSFAPSGSEGQVKFSTLNGGEITLTRQYGDPPPPFQISALTQDQIQPVNLVRDLSTFVSTLTARDFEVPDFGSVRVNADEDIALSSNLFKLIAGEDQLNLQLGIPQAVSSVQETALFYYYSADFNGVIPIKTASVYQFYDLSNNQLGSHGYDDQFINVFTQGKEIALKFNERFYLLSHHNPSNQPAFFNLNNLRLKTINGDRFLNPAVSGSEAQFTVDGGRIDVEVNDLDNSIVFSATTRRVLEAAILWAGNYSAVLTTANRVMVGRNLLSLVMCNKELYQAVRTADVCYADTDKLVEDFELLVLNGATYLLETNGQMGEAKEVTIRRVLQIGGSDSVIDNWNTFVSQILDGDVPIINVSNELYEPVLQNNILGNLGLQKYRTRERFVLRNVQDITQITSNGTFVLPERNVFIEQSLRGAQQDQFVRAVFDVKDYTFLPENGSRLILNNSEGQVVSFAGVIDGEEYTLAIPSNGTNSLAIISLLESSGDALFVRIFAEGDYRIIPLDGALTEILVEEINDDGEVVVSVRRR